MVLHEKGAKHIKNCETILRQDKPLLEKTKLKEFEIKYSVAIACHSSVKAVDHLSGVVKEYSSKSAIETSDSTERSVPSSLQTLLPSLTTRNLLKS